MKGSASYGVTQGSEVIRAPGGRDPTNSGSGRVLDTGRTGRCAHQRRHRAASLRRIQDTCSTAPTAPQPACPRTLFLLRGASPLGLPNTLSREPLRRLAPFAWAHSRARSPADDVET